MNFSNTNKLRKILSLATAIVMVSTMFTGCMKKEPVETDPPFCWRRSPPISLRLPLPLRSLRRSMRTWLPFSAR